ncbi:MAG: hypothetical protein JST68_03200 [Bacteroidetes bacterium]|nr:hypothetical protein [Bacteroidota bacterium]
MKKLLLSPLLIAIITTTQAQIKSLTRPGTTIAQSRLDSAGIRPNPGLRPGNVGKDLKVSLISIQKDPSSFAIGSAGIYTINFEMVNSGTENIDITGVIIQSYLINAAGNFSNPQGGYSLIPGAPNFPEKPILHPGDKYQWKFVKNGFDPAQNNGNKFVIKVDNGNAIAEINEANNTLEIPVIGNLESSSAPLPDLTFQVTRIAPVTGSTYLNTSVEIYLVNIGQGEIPLDVVNKIIPMIQVYPAGSPGVNLYNEAFPLAPRIAGNQTYPGYNTTNSSLLPGGKIRIGGTVHINGLTTGATVIFHCTIGTSNNENIPETNKANNTIDYLYTVQ